MTDVGRLRVGHAERRHVVGLLQQQYAEGRLTAAELEQRSLAAHSALSFADLDRIVADLPVVAPSRELRWASSTDRSLVGSDPDHRLVLSAGMSSHVRRGVWTVPAFLSLRGGMGTVKIDFQGAICPHPVVDVAVMAGLGTVVLVIPEGWAANTEQVSKGMGSVSNRVDEVPQPGRPLLVLHGASMVGSVKVRYPGWNDRLQFRRSLRRRGPEHTLSGRESVAQAPTPSPGSSTGRAQGPQDAPRQP